MSATFLERSIAGMTAAIEHATASERSTSRGGILQSVDARVKLAGVVATIAAAAAARNLETLAAAFTAACILALVAGVNRPVLAKAWAIVLFFTVSIAAPALFTTPGTTLAELSGLRITLQGARSGAFLLLRSGTTVTLALTLVASTPWPRLIAALRSFRIPAAVVLVIAMTYRYIFVLLRIAGEMFVARRSRSIGPLAPAERRLAAGATAGVLLGRSVALAEDVYLAMRSRGFRGEAVLLDEPRMRMRDWVAGAVFGVAAIAIVWSGLR